jgi:uncharacterized phage protein (TIGR02220 family)
LADYTDHLFKTDFIETFIKDMEGKNLNLETIKQAYEFGIRYFEDGFDFIEGKKKKTYKKTYNDDIMDKMNIIIEYLNDKTKSAYTLNKTNCECINGRLNEGYNINQFKAVIDNKCNQWLNTPQQKYLRPITLFSASKFENYLNEPQTEINGKQKSTSSIAKLQSATNKAKEYFK